MRKLTMLLIHLMPLLSTAQLLQQNELTFNHLFVKDGLPESQVNCLMQDKEKYIWAGTQKGLVRYDGYKTKTYDLGVKTPYLSITTLFEDKKGNLWVGTQSEGLFLYDRGNDTFKHFKINPLKTDGQRDTEVQLIFNAFDEDLWLRTGKIFGQEMVYFSPTTGKTEVYSIEENGSHKLNTMLIFGFVQTKDGRFWLGGQNGLFEFIAKEKKFIQHPILVDSVKLRHYWLNKEDPLKPGVIWANIDNVSDKRLDKVADKSLWAINTNDFSIKIFEKKKVGGLADCSIFDLQFDSRNELWVSTDSGLSSLNRQRDT